MTTDCTVTGCRVYLDAPDLDTLARKGFYHTVRIGSGSGALYAFEPWLAKTAVRLPEGFTEASELPKPATDARLAVRTPRHLRGLSLYYDKYFAAETEGRAFVQERNADYSAYEWEGFANCGLEQAQRQEPVGANGFRARYDGGSYEISHVSIVSEQADAIGLFGRNEGTLANIVLVTDYGYGYYMREGQESDVTLASEGIAVSAGDGGAGPSTPPRPRRCERR